MTALESWYSASELLDLPGMPGTRKGLLEKAKREAWKSRPRTGRGGGQEYHITSLPTETQQHLIAAAAPEPEPLPAPVPAQPPAQPLQRLDTMPQDVTQLNRSQRETLTARHAILNEVDRMSQVLGRSRAVNILCESVANGLLREDLLARIPQALGKRKQRGELSRSTVYRWLSDRATGELALAPKAPQRYRLPDWGPAFLQLYQRPQKPSIPWCIEQLRQVLPADRVPSRSQVYRLIKKMGAVERQKGRMGPRKLKDIKTFIRRDTSENWPTDIYLMDGHAFDAEIQHPAHGRPFRPELTTCVDAATRRVVGWSIALAESSWAVLDALRHACTTGGIPAIFYVDNGSGYKNAVMTADATGLVDRLQITMEHSIAYNSQARGLVERLHASLWVRAAKELPTFIGADMDTQAKQAAHKLTRKEIKSVGSSRILPGFSAFVRFCEAHVEAYNHRPHTSLPSITDPETGTRRHETPMEAWARAEREGFEPVAVEPALADDLFRPYAIRKTLRGEVSLFGNTYFHKDLEEHHDSRVRIGYDIHDAQHVWVRDINDRLLCIAEFEANKRSFYPVSAMEEAAAKRAKGRAARAEQVLDEIDAEYQGARPAIEHQPISAEQEAIADAMLARLVPQQEDEQPEPVALPEPIQERAQADDGRPVFHDEYEFYAWATAQPQLGEQDRRHLQALEQDPAFMTTWREVFGQGHGQ